MTEEVLAISPESAPQSPATQQTPAGVEEVRTLAQVEVVGGIGQYPVTNALRDLIDAGVRGQSGMVLLYTLIQKLESDLKESRDEIKELRQEVDKWRTDYYATKQNNAVFVEQLSDLKKTRKLQNIMITLGGIVIGVATPYLITQRTGASIAAALLGFVLLVVGWTHGDKK
jgi:hypothetical protein